MNQLELRLGLQQLLYAFRVVYAGHLHQNLMGTLRAMSLHQRFGNSHRIQTTLNNPLRLVGSLLRKGPLRRRRQRPGNRVAAG